MHDFIFCTWYWAQTLYEFSRLNEGPLHHQFRKGNQFNQSHLTWTCKITKIGQRYRHQRKRKGDENQYKQLPFCDSMIALLSLTKPEKLNQVKKTHPIEKTEVHPTYYGNYPKNSIFTPNWISNYKAFISDLPKCAVSNSDLPVQCRPKYFPQIKQKYRNELIT